MREIHLRLSRLERRIAPIDGVALILPQSDAGGWALQLGNFRKTFGTVEEAKDYFDEMYRTGKTRSRTVIVWG